jgi:hypothetical protein
MLLAASVLVFIKAEHRQERGPQPLAYEAQGGARPGEGERESGSQRGPQRVKEAAEPDREAPSPMLAEIAEDERAPGPRREQRVVPEPAEPVTTEKSTSDGDDGLPGHSVATGEEGFAAYSRPLPVDDCVTDEAEALRQRVAQLEAENQRLGVALAMNELAADVPSPPRSPEAAGPSARGAAVSEDAAACETQLTPRSMAARREALAGGQAQSEAAAPAATRPGAVADLAPEMAEQAAPPADREPDVFAQLAQAQQRASRLEKQLAHQAQQTEALATKLRAASEELSQASRRDVREAKADKEALGALDIERAKLARLLLDARRAYISAASPDKEGLEARQQAARRAKLSDRLAAARKADSAAIGKELGEKLDALLTRLDMIRDYGIEPTRQFDEAVARSGILQQIDDALASAGPQTRALLLETRFVLMEGGNA